MSETLDITLRRLRLDRLANVLEQHGVLTVGALEDKLDDTKRLRQAVAPFVSVVQRSKGRIPTERLSFADWHRLCRAHKELLDE